MSELELLRNEIAELKAANLLLSNAPIYILEDFDRWDEHFPWEIKGYTTSEEEANAWVESAKGYKDCIHRFKKVERKK